MNTKTPEIDKTLAEAFEKIVEGPKNGQENKEVNNLRNDDSNFPVNLNIGR